MSRSVFKLTRLPTELWRYILSLVASKNDLRHLCLTSKKFLPESRRLLYRNIQLKGTRGISLWIETILSSDIHTALVFTLALPSRARLSGYYEHALARCLAALPHLVELSISHSMTVYSDSSLTYLVPKMLEGCSKNLRTFRNELEDINLNQALFEPSGFFKAHPSIDRIYIASTKVHNTLPSYYDGEMPSNILPGLKTLHIENVDILQAFRTKPIQRLRIGRVTLTEKRIEEAIAALKPFRETLTSFCVGLYDSTGILVNDQPSSITSFAEQLVICLPNLVHLSVFGDVTQVCYAIALDRSLGTHSQTLSTQTRNQNRTWLPF